MCDRWPTATMLPRRTGTLLDSKRRRPFLNGLFKTYGLELKDLFPNGDLARGTYRRSVSTIIPEMTKVTWSRKKNELTAAAPGLTRPGPVYNLPEQAMRGNRARSSNAVAAERSFCLSRGNLSQIRPLPGSVIPPADTGDGPVVHGEFQRHRRAVRLSLARLRSGLLPDLPDTNPDTGRPARIRDYRKADETHLELPGKLKRGQFVGAGLRRDILACFDRGKVDSKIADALGELRSAAIPQW
jgi:hypothetical protein